jgi:hypothetical protein
MIPQSTPTPTPTSTSTSTPKPLTTHAMMASQRLSVALHLMVLVVQKAEAAVYRPILHIIHQYDHLCHHFHHQDRLQLHHHLPLILHQDKMFQT